MMFVHNSGLRDIFGRIRVDGSALTMTMTTIKIEVFHVKQGVVRNDMGRDRGQGKAFSSGEN